MRVAMLEISPSAVDKAGRSTLHAMLRAIDREVGHYSARSLVWHRYGQYVDENHCWFKLDGLRCRVRSRLKAMGRPRGAP